jgi:predicted chitinase
MNFPVPIPVISSILGHYGPIEKVAANWPLVEAALDGAEIYSPLCAVVAIATISVETGMFCPMKERGGPTYITNLYENRKDLGNVNPGDGVRFRGRGFIQITGRRDYDRFGREIGHNLIANPDAALDPRVAAAILALVFKERDVRVFADQENWEMVRRRVVSAAFTEWARFFDVVTKLVTALNNPPPAGSSQEAHDDRA